MLVPKCRHSCVVWINKSVGFEKPLENYFRRTLRSATRELRQFLSQEGFRDYRWGPHCDFLFGLARAQCPVFGCPASVSSSRFPGYGVLAPKFSMPTFKVVGSVIFFPKCSSLWASAVNAADGNVQKINDVAALSFSIQWDGGVDVFQCFMKRFYVYTIKNFKSAINLATVEVDSEKNTAK